MYNLVVLFHVLYPFFSSHVLTEVIFDTSARFLATYVFPRL